MHNENEKNGEKKIKYYMYNETIQPPETNTQYLGWRPSLLGGRARQGPRCPEIYHRYKFWVFRMWFGAYMAGLHNKTAFSQTQILGVKNLVWVI